MDAYFNDWIPVSIYWVETIADGGILRVLIRAIKAKNIKNM